MRASRGATRHTSQQSAAGAASAVAAVADVCGGSVASAAADSPLSSESSLESVEFSAQRFTVCTHAMADSLQKLYRRVGATVVTTYTRFDARIVGQLRLSLSTASSHPTIQTAPLHLAVVSRSLQMAEERKQNVLQLYILNTS